MSDATPEPDTTTGPASPSDPAVPEVTDPARESTAPAFDVDLDPEEQGTAEAASEPSG